MKVKIGDTIYSGKETPIMLILNETDKNAIINKSKEDFDDCIYCEYPDTQTEETIIAWMNEKCNAPEYEEIKVNNNE